MKKTFIFLAAAAALVACSKNEETTYVSPADNEISFLVAPKTKAGHTEFTNTWTFKSTAFYLPKTESWASHTSTPAVYINGVDISYNTTDGVWRNAAKKYYWPKDGKLTFFAWTSLKQGTVSGTYDTTNKVVKPTENQTVSYLASGVAVDYTNGVKIADYDVTADANKNYDLLVADIKADQTKNTDPATYYKVGVPTLFKHKLSQVFFTAVTVDSNKAAYDYKTNDDITFTLNSITFKSIDKTNTYTQGVTESSCAGAWGTASATADLTYTNYASGKELNDTVTPLIEEGNLYYYLPQSFVADQTTSDCFVVDYKITYANGTVENLTATFPLNSATAENVIFEKWEMGKRYTINLQFSLNEILWDPAVEEWEDANKEVTVS